jgi:RHS repeat-associated protein
MGSVIGLVDGNGDRVSRIIYDGFGEVKSGDDGTSLGGDFRFQGQWLETESGLYYMRARDYDAKTGLFLSRDAVDVQEQSVEAFNPYQFVYNNPLIYSDLTGLFTIAELGSAQNIQNTLTASVRRYVGAQAKDYVLQKLGDSFGNVVASTFNAFIPGSTAFFDILREGYDFEDVLKGIVCSYFDGLPLKDNLYIDVKIPNGTPINNGKNCVGTPYGDRRAYERSISRNGSTPDFIFRDSLPLAYKSGDSGAYLVGDVKLFLGAVRINQRNQSQFENMVKYAKKYQALPFVSYIAFSDSNILPGNHALTDRGVRVTF